MGWTVPAYSREKVNRAGRCYVDPGATKGEREDALVVINNWRSSHSFPLNTLQVNLRSVAANHDDDPTVARRIKRLPSIRHKLQRMGGMDLSRMQDIGGARAVVRNVSVVHKMADFYRTKSRIKHKLIREDLYTVDPPPSGYRGVHLVYAYFSDHSAAYNGLRIELQIRSRLQHAWATAVETVGTFTEQALKSSLGDPEWLRFFALMSSALAVRESTPLVPGTPNETDVLTRDLRHYVDRLDVVDRLQAFNVALRTVEQELSAKELGKGGTFLLELDIPSQELTLSRYNDPSQAASEYALLERKIEDASGLDAVLVSAESLVSLRRAFPNYFADTRAFVDAVKEAIG